jgi:tRNA (uracil-5-)-methyltransferase TRM9
VNENTAAKLLAINRQFYQTFSLQFSQTRLRLQPGVKQILEGLPREGDTLDLGCGNGELALQLLKRGHQGLYVGLDQSRDLLARARGRWETHQGPDGPGETEQEGSNQNSLQAIFLHRDLASPDWNVSIPGSPFAVGFAFAVLHHLPGHDLRLQTLLNARSLLVEGGEFIHSEWQFLNSPRLRARIQPWESIGVDPHSVDRGDYLLDWRRGGYAYRYVHHFEQDELARLAEETGFSPRHTFHSDGEGGNLGLYQIWQAI